MNKFTLLLSTTVVTAAPTFAGINIFISQQGSDVVATASGSLNIDNLTYYALEPSQPAQVLATHASVDLGINSVDQDVYQADSGPVAFGSGGSQIFADSATGDPFAVDGFNGLPLIAVPTGYTSGTQIDSSATWLNKNLEDLGLTPGNYIFGWVGDSVTVQVVPEPGVSAALAGAGVLLFAALYRRKRHS